MRLRNTKPPTRPNRKQKHDPDEKLISSPLEIFHRTKRDFQSLQQQQQCVVPFCHVKNVEEEKELSAGMTSASSCIVMELPRRPSNNKQTKTRGQQALTHIQSWHHHSNKCRFKPVYTHQFFSDERIRGYRPTLAAEAQVASILRGASLHSSFEAVAKYELSVSVKLAPSCRRSCVVVSVTPYRADGGNIGQLSSSVAHQVKKSLDMSTETQPDVNVASESEDECEYRGRKRTRGHHQEGGPRKSRRVKVTQTAVSDVSGVRRSKRVNQVSSGDESEENGGAQVAPIAVRRSGRNGKKSCDESTSAQTTASVAIRRTGRKSIASKKSREESVSAVAPIVRRSGRNCIPSRKFGDEPVNAETFRRSGRNCKTEESDENHAPTVVRRSGRNGTQGKKALGGDEAENHASVQNVAPNPLRRSGRNCIPSKKALFRIEEGEQSLSASPTETLTSSNKLKQMTRQNISHIPCETPTLTRSMSQSSDSLRSCASVTGDSNLDGGKMRVETIVRTISRGLPKVEGVLLYDGETYSVVGEDSSPNCLASTVKTMEEIDDDYLDAPVGTVIDCYTASKRPMSLQGSGGIEETSVKSANEATFVLSLADMEYDEDARKYHDEVEKLALWWIETGECVNMGSTKGIRTEGKETGGHWKVLYLFEQHMVAPPGRRRAGRPSKAEKSKFAPKYSLAGYMTLLFHEKKMVVCQVLILPPYQRSGHGRELMIVAYKKLVFGRTISYPICLIDVEVPGKAFVCLRDQIDYNLIHENMSKLKKRNILNIPEECYMEPINLARRGEAIRVLPDDIMAKMALKLKITQRQFQIAYEIWLLSKIDFYIKDKLSNLTDATEMNQQVATLEACYKSIVKRSLLQVLREKLGEKFDSLAVDEKRERLEMSFVKTICHYRALL